MNGIAVWAARFHDKRFASGDAVAALGLFGGRGDDEDAGSGEASGSLGEGLETVGVDAVVIGEEKGHGW
jgi:hypothetical protein